MILHEWGAVAPVSRCPVSIWTKKKSQHRALQRKGSASSNVNHVFVSEVGNSSQTDFTLDRFVTYMTHMLLKVDI